MIISFLYRNLLYKIDIGRSQDKPFWVFLAFQKVIKKNIFWIDLCSILGRFWSPRGAPRGTKIDLKRHQQIDQFSRPRDGGY